MFRHAEAVWAGGGAKRSRTRSISFLRHRASSSVISTTWHRFCADAPGRSLGQHCAVAGAAHLVLAEADEELNERAKQQDLVLPRHAHARGMTVAAGLVTLRRQCVEQGVCTAAREARLPGKPHRRDRERSRGPRRRTRPTAGSRRSCPRVLCHAARCQPSARPPTREDRTLCLPREDSVCRHIRRRLIAEAMRGCERGRVPIHDAA